jgi:biotin transport system substrate-specific component
MATRTLVRIALFAAIIAALGLLPKIDLPFAGGVPVTAQTLGVMLTGVLIGPRYGAAAVLLFIAVVVLGAPLLAGGRGGLGVLFGPTVGFLVGWVPGVIVTGMAFRVLTRLPTGVSAAVASIAGCIVVVYAFGIAGLVLITGIPLSKAAMASLVFVPGDLLKAIAVGAVAAAMPTSKRSRSAFARP